MCDSSPVLWEITAALLVIFSLSMRYPYFQHSRMCPRCVDPNKIGFLLGLSFTASVCMTFFKSPYSLNDSSYVFGLMMFLAFIGLFIGIGFGCPVARMVYLGVCLFNQTTEKQLSALRRENRGKVDLKPSLANVWRFLVRSVEPSEIGARL